MYRPVFSQPHSFGYSEGPFEKGNYFTLKPKGGPKVKVELLETTTTTTPLKKRPAG
jgi:hypothetical protein